MATTSDETVGGCGIGGIGGIIGVGVPGDFCHDNYEHPLLWCDEKKRLVERKNAEESMRMWRRRKAEEMARKDKEKQEYYELFLKHCPWGRPGGGAPNLDVRRKDITAIGLHSTPATLAPLHRLTSHQSCPRFSDYFLQHHKKCLDPLTNKTITAHHHATHHHPHHAHQHLHHHTVHHHHQLSDSSTRPVAGSTVTICDISGPMMRKMLGNGNGSGGGGTGSTQPNGKIGETLEITLKNHPSMSFRNKGHVDIEVRYKPTATCGKGKPILERIVVTESDKFPAVPQVVVHGKAAATKSPKAKKKLSEKMEKPPIKDPWGKSGPGGKPWRDPKDAGSTLMKSLGWTNKSLLKDLDQDNPATPAEKHTFRKTRPNKKQQLLRCCDMCTCSCPALLNSGGVSGGGRMDGIAGGMGSPLKPLQKRAKQQQNHHSPQKREMPAFKIDLKKQQEHKICPRLLRRAAGQQQSTTTDNSAAHHNKHNTANRGGDSATLENSGGGVELVPLLARRRANNRPISLSSTDVTKRTASHDRIPTAADLRYLHDLNEQISLKRRSISAAQQYERDLCNQHFETFDTFWGRPGHGAPVEIKQKLKLNNLLYGDQGQGLE